MSAARTYSGLPHQAASSIRPRRQHQACLLLGSNIEPEVNLQKTVRYLREHFFVENVSAVWETSAVGSDGPNFLNLAIVLKTDLSIEQMKEKVLRPYEAQLGRVRTSDKNAPRPIDIDIVAWDARVLDAAVWQYAHAAVPVAELMPCYQSDETGETLEKIAARLVFSSVIRDRPEVTALLT